MSSQSAIEQRLRTARPAVGAAPPTLESVLGFVARAEADTARAEADTGGTEAAGARDRRGRRWWRRTRVVVPAIAAVVVLAGAGGGALLLEQGTPLQAAYLLPANPETGLGRPEAASLAPLPMRVADPDGGPPWVMRVIRTTRGLECLQGGRLVNGQLGGLGSGYAFGGDGRFHPFLAEDAIGTDACPAVGSEQPAFLPGPPLIVTANALPLAGENVAPGDRVHCDLPGEENWGVRCPQKELRQVAMGLLGPDASSISVASEGGTSFTVKPYGPEGAYLIVLSAPPNANTSMDSHAVGGAVLNVTYTDGSQCRIPATGAADQCHARAAGDEGGSIPTSLPSTVVHAAYLPSAGGTGSAAARPRPWHAGEHDEGLPACRLRRGNRRAGRVRRVHRPGRRPERVHRLRRRTDTEGSAGLRDAVADRLPAQPARHRRRRPGADDRPLAEHLCHELLRARVPRTFLRCRRGIRRRRSSLRGHRGAVRSPPRRQPDEVPDGGVVRGHGAVRPVRRLRSSG